MRAERHYERMNAEKRLHDDALVTAVDMLTAPERYSMRAKVDLLTSLVRARTALSHEADGCGKWDSIADELRKGADACAQLTALIVGV